MSDKLYAVLFYLLFCPIFTIGQNNYGKLPNDPSATIGTLDNGIQYIIHPNSGSRTEYRLVLNVGSLQETPEERGYAHFLEHIVFNNTVDFPDGKLTDTLRYLGYRYGRDINAYTTYDRTVYELSLLDTSRQDLALSILANMLSKVVIRSTDVEKERKIIRQEINDYRTTDFFSQQKLEGSEYVGRLPIGTVSDVNQIQASPLASFYKKWYRAELATIIVTGNVEASSAIQDIKNNFGFIPKSREVSDRTQNYNSFHPHFQTGWHKQPQRELQKNKLEIIRFHPVSTLLNENDFRENLILNIYQRYVSRKLNQGQAKARHQSIWYLPQQNENSLEFQSETKDDLLTQLRHTASILSSIEKNGISEQELQQLKDEVSARPAQTGTNAKLLADSYLDQVAVGHRYIDQKNRAMLTKQYLPTVQNEDILKLHRNIWTSVLSNSLFLFQYDSTLFDIDTRSELDQAWHTGWANPVGFEEFIEPASEDDTINSHRFDWDSIPLPLKANTAAQSIVEESYLPQLQATELILSNGLHIVVKPLEKSKEVVLSFATRRGLDQVSDAEYPFFQDANYFIGESGLRGITEEDYDSILIQKGLSTLVSMTDHAAIVNTMSETGSLEDAVQLTYRKLYDYQKPKADFDEYIQQQIDQSDGQAVGSSFSGFPTMALKRKVETYKSRNQRQFRELVSEKDWKSVSLDRMFEVFDQSTQHLDNAYIIICGKVDLTEVKEKVLPYFAQFENLPATSMDTVVKTTHKIKTPTYSNDSTQSDEHARVDAASVYGGQIARNIKEYIIANMLREWLNHNFIKLSREQQGLVYSPDTELDVEFADAPHTNITINFSAQQKDLPILKDVAMNLVDRLHTEEIDQKTLAQLKRSIANNKRAHLSAADAMQWVEKLRENYLNFGNIQDFDQYDQILQNITADEIQLVAKKMLSKSEYLFVSEPQ